MATTSVANDEMHICSIKGMPPKNGRIHHARKIQPGRAELSQYYIHFILLVSSMSAECSTRKISSLMAVCHVF